MKSTQFKQSLSILLSTSLLTSTLLPDIAHASRPATLQNELISRLALPSTLGTITDQHVGLRPEAPLIIIQDLHLHYATQKRILKILNHLDSAGMLAQSIAVEGVEGPYDLTRLATYPAGPVKEKLVDYFMRKGELSADEAYSILKGNGHILYGVDDAKYYNLNRGLFANTLAQRHALLTQLVRIQEEIQLLK